MRTELRKWEAGSRHLSYPHYIGGDAMLPLGDTSSLQLSSQVSRMWEKWLFWEIQSICTCILYTYIYTDSDALIHWMVLPFWCSQHALIVSGQGHTFRVLSQRPLLCSLQSTEEEFADCMSEDQYLFCSRCLSIPKLFINNFAIFLSRFRKEPSWKLYDLYQVFSSLKMVPCSSVPAKLSACQTTKRRRRSRHSVGAT